MCSKVILGVNVKVKSKGDCIRLVFIRERERESNKCGRYEEEEDGQLSDGGAN